MENMDSIKKYKIVPDGDFKPIKIDFCSRGMSDFARKFYFEDIDVFESFFVILINGGNVLGWAKIAQGGTNLVHVDIKILAMYAIGSLCNSIVLVHNHPSGAAYPSNEDRVLTERIKKGLALLDIGITDHIILSKDSYYSFAEEGIL